MLRSRIYKGWMKLVVKSILQFCSEETPKKRYMFIIHLTEYTEEWSLSEEKLYFLSILMMQTLMQEGSVKFTLQSSSAGYLHFTPWRRWYHTIQETRGKPQYIPTNKLAPFTNNQNTYIKLFHLTQGNKFPFTIKFQPLVLAKNKNLIQLETWFDNLATDSLMWP